MESSNIVELTLRWSKEARIAYEQLPAGTKSIVIRKLSRVASDCHRTYKAKYLQANPHIPINLRVEAGQDSYYLSLSGDYVELSNGERFLLINNLRELLDIGGEEILIDFTDEIFDKMKMNDQLLVVIHETYIGPIEKCIKCKEGLELTSEVLTAIAEKFKMT